MAVRYYRFFSISAKQWWFSNNTLKTVLFFVLALLFISHKVNADNFNKYFIQKVTVCYDDIGELTVANFFEQKCDQVSLDKVEPSNKLIWIGASFELELPELIDTPLGLFFSAKASGEFYLNGQLIGRNGRPAISKEDEVQGVMDTVVYVPKELIKPRQNELVIKLSAHNSRSQLSDFISFAIITHYESPQDIVLRNYLPSFIPLGVLVIGFAFSCALAVLQSKGMRNVLLPMFALVVALQLLIEVSRGLISYEYSYQDMRLLAILLLSMLSGQCLLLYTIRSFVKNNQWVWFAISMSITLAIVYFGTAIEDKTVLAFQLPAAICLLITVYEAYQRHPFAMKHAIALFIFSAAIVVKPNAFLDIYYYYFVAALMVFFFIQHAVAYKTEKSLKLQAQSNAQRLQHALDEYKEQQQPSKIKLNLSGKIEWVSSDGICFVKGARDYVEVMLSDGRCLLHNEGLATMENKLSATFLRVHRSYIVNKRFIQSLEKLPSGGGNLILTTGDALPVSRRIMPKVKEQLN
ncbi:LytR/AlgR family response regulator transcription factor [Pseudoalteromonas luteoviolacea]|uniref:LytR/AlgR family response regulator transcription factor n=1 Tax=Pseudoalteromonas luteoviolacea TaxID=43657 RepID=UPI001428BBEB|nr:LytTR family DNA-binding domain-containing protein [Pseudoalteromonas luteoviolacea]